MNPVILRHMNILLLALFAGTQFPSPLRAATSAESGLRTDRLLNHVRVLVSEEFEGRAPGTSGEEKTVDYVVRQFKALGLQPGNPDGTYVQSVPLIGITGTPAGSYRVGDKRTDFVLPRDAVFWSRRPVPDVSVTDAEMVFVGYGVVAPEYGWDEFTQNDYHKPTDVIKADWDLSGAIQDLELFIAVGRAVADGDQRPEWKESPVFQVPRQSMPTAVELGLVPAPAELRIGQGEFRVTARTQVVARDQAIPKARQLIDALAPAMGFRLEFTEGESSSASAIVLALNESLRAELGGEGYTLAVSPQRIDLRAAEPAGLFYAVQTLRQLLSPAVFASKPNREPEWVIPAVSITDIPRFAWRGLLIDPARHFIPVEEVKRFMDIMAWHKFNRLQMHLTDNEGWRIEIKKYPKLTELGSQMDWTSRHRGGAGPRCFGFYTQDDIRALVQYAAERHITLVPEIEMPYHAGSAIVAYPQHGVDPARLAGLPVDQRWAQSNGLLGPRPETVAFMQDVLAEVIALFPSPFIHIGGDEANLQLWTDDPEMQALMRQLGCEDAHQLHSWFVRQMDTFLSARGRRMIGWDEILQGGLAPGATVMSWRGVGGGITAAQAGHDVIMAPTSHTYFDYYQGPPDREPVAIGGLIPLQKVYEFEPIPPELNAKEAKHVLGGQGQLWGEFIATAGHRDYMTWPRACALSEVLWSPAADRNLDRFLQRLDRHRERLTAADVQFRPNDAS